jgi:pimeloyl-ACP methyl ester carboxylesterase
VSKPLRAALTATGLILALLLIGPFLVPIPPLDHTVPPEQLADPESRFLEISDLQVHYKMTGEGEPAFVLLHGFGASVFSWREVMEPLGTMGTVVAFDRPAFGLTERPLSWERGDNPYTPEAQVTLVGGLMGALGIDDAILVGNSAGGTVAIRTALAHPERVRALVLADAAVYEGGGAPGWIRPLLDTRQMDRLGPLLARQISRRGDAFLESAWQDPSKITPQVLTGYRVPLRAQNWDRALWELTKASYQQDLVDRIPDLAIHSLVITGGDDRIVPVESSVRLAEQLPSAELVVIPNCGHLPQEECPQPFLEAVTAFVEGLSE